MTPSAVTGFTETFMLALLFGVPLFLIAVLLLLHADIFRR